MPFYKDKDLWRLPVDILRALSLRRHLDNATETMVHYGKAPPPSKRIVFDASEFVQWVEFARALEEKQENESQGMRPAMHNPWEFDTVAEMRLAYG